MDLVLNIMAGAVGLSISVLAVFAAWAMLCFMIKGLAKTAIYIFKG
jgi:hypothetical protein